MGRRNRQGTKDSLDDKLFQKRRHCFSKRFSSSISRCYGKGQKIWKATSINYHDVQTDVKRYSRGTFARTKGKIFARFGIARVRNETKITRRRNIQRHNIWTKGGMRNQAMLKCGLNFKSYGGFYFVWPYVSTTQWVCSRLTQTSTVCTTQFRWQIKSYTKVRIILAWPRIAQLRQDLYIVHQKHEAKDCC